MVVRDAAVAGGAGVPTTGRAGGGEGICVTAAGGLVGAPADVDGDGLQLGGVGGNLEAQSHGGGDHESAAHGFVIGVLAGVLLGGGVGRLLLDAGDGSTSGGGGLEVVGGAGQPGGGDAPQEVALVWWRGEDLRVALGGSDELALQDFDDSGPSGGRAVAEFLVEDVGGAVVRMSPGRRAGGWRARGGNGLRCQGSPPGPGRSWRACGRAGSGNRR